MDKKLEQLNALIEMAALINSSLDTHEIRQQAILAATKLMDAETGSLLMVDPETGELYFEVALGEQGARLKQVRLKAGQGIAGWVAQNCEPQIVLDVPGDPRFFADADKKSDFQTRDMICVPVITKGKTLGVLQAINKKQGKFDGDDMKMLCTLADQVAVAIENANLFSSMRETFYDTAAALADTIEKRDPYTGGHTKRVMDYSVSLARYMGFEKDFIEDLRLAAILHDIGKIGVSDVVLNKKGALSDEEFREMNMHTSYGSEILEHVKALQPVIPGVRGHHEKYDGTGYPDGFKAREIPLMARLIAVVDTFDAMTSDRPYRKGLSTDIAIDELNKHSGTQFDAEIVKAFLSAFEEGAITHET